MKLKIIFTLCLVSLLFAGKTTAQSNISTNLLDSVNLKACVAQLPKGIPINLADVGRYFVGKPYVPYTLEGGNREKLVVNLREFDCTTFVESCIAIYKTATSGFNAYSNLKDQLLNVRYRDGWINDYTSRLHYISDWIYDNEKRGNFRNITLELGGDTINKQINYMTTHSDLYKLLKENENYIEKMNVVEERINNRHDFYVIPTSKIKSIQNQIKDGDIICFATKIEGLDYSHLGIAYHEDGKLTMIDASSIAKKIVIERKSLEQYCRSSKNCIGITVLRMAEK